MDNIDVAAAARVLSLHVPLTPATHRIAGAGLLSRMSPEAIVVNTAPGELVEEAALARWAVRRASRSRSWSRC